MTNIWYNENGIQKKGLLIKRLSDQDDSKSNIVEITDMETNFPKFIMDDNVFESADDAMSANNKKINDIYYELKNNIHNIDELMEFIMNHYNSNKYDVNEFEMKSALMKLYSTFKRDIWIITINNSNLTYIDLKKMQGNVIEVKQYLCDIVSKLAHNDENHYESGTSCADEVEEERDSLYASAVFMDYEINIVATRLIKI